MRALALFLSAVPILLGLLLAFVIPVRANAEEIETSREKSPPRLQRPGSSRDREESELRGQGRRLERPGRDVRY